MAEEKVGFIGLGAMGAPIAANLIAADIVPVVWNRTASKALPLAAKGASIAVSARETASPGGVVVTMLADDSAVETMVVGDTGIAAGLARAAFTYR
jgi:3-hydroxyisobutyrate dehydrogenase-like beta-hydroxyacid dehydrogenase